MEMVRIRYRSVFVMEIDNASHREEEHTQHCGDGEFGAMEEIVKLLIDDRGTSLCARFVTFVALSIH